MVVASTLSRAARARAARKSELMPRVCVVEGRGCDRGHWPPALRVRVGQQPVPVVDDGRAGGAPDALHRAGTNRHAPTQFN